MESPSKKRMQVSRNLDETFNRGSPNKRGAASMNPGESNHSRTPFKKTLLLTPVINSDLSQLISDAYPSNRFPPVGISPNNRSFNQVKKQVGAQKAFIPLNVTMTQFKGKKDEHGVEIKH